MNDKGKRKGKRQSTVKIDWMRDSICILPSAKLWCRHRPAGDEQGSTRALQLDWFESTSSKKHPTTDVVGCFLAEDEGFEPPQTESESGVLPLHKSSICDLVIAGGDWGTRTLDLMRVKHAL